MRKTSFFTHPLFRMVLVLLVAVLLTVTARAGDLPAMELQPVADLDSQVVHIAVTGVPGDERLFLVRQQGIIEVYDGTGVLPQPFLDIDSLVGSSGFEQGLLSAAFHPDYASNGLFYVDYTDNLGHTVVARYQVSADPDIADAGSAQVVLTQDQPAGNHNGGQLQFGPDGYLYVSFGDGGGGCDNSGSGCNAQKTDSWLGSLLRIDIDGDDFPGDAARNYAIPADNPFLGDAAVLDEIWAYGLRNPWRFSFDRVTGDLWIGDVGQNSREEVDFQLAGAGGQNYGWPFAEGNLCGTCSTFACPLPLTCESLDPPHYDYPQVDSRCSITGGFVYRGSAIPQLVGDYVFGDYCTGEIVALDPSTLDDPVVIDADFGLTTFGQDIDGELYVAIGSSVLKLVPVVPEVVFEDGFEE